MKRYNSSQYALTRPSMPDNKSLNMQFFVPPSFSNKSLLFVCLFVLREFG